MEDILTWVAQNWRYWISIIPVPAVISFLVLFLKEKKSRVTDLLELKNEIRGIVKEEGISKETIQDIIELIKDNKSHNSGVAEILSLLATKTGNLNIMELKALFDIKKGMLTTGNEIELEALEQELLNKKEEEAKLKEEIAELKVEEPKIYERDEKDIYERKEENIYKR